MLGIFSYSKCTPPFSKNVFSKIDYANVVKCLLAILSIFTNEKYFFSNYSKKSKIYSFSNKIYFTKTSTLFQKNYDFLFWKRFRMIHNVFK